MVSGTGVTVAKRAGFSGRAAKSAARAWGTAAQPTPANQWARNAKGWDSPVRPRVRRKAAGR